MSSASRSIVIASRSRSEVHSPSSPSSPARGARSPPPSADEQRAVADEVGVAADRRGEVAVARRAQAGVAEVARRVVGLLERAQDERAEREPAAPGAPHVSARRSLRDRRRRARPPATGTCCSGSGGVGTSSEASCVDEALDALGVRALVHAVEARHAALLRAGCATASLAAIIRCSIRRWDSVCARARHSRDVARARRTRTRAPRSRPSSAPLRSRARCSAAARRRARRASGSAHGSCGRLAAGEDAVHALVVQALVGADQRAVERRARDLAPCELELDRDRQALLARHAASRRRWRAPAAASARRRPARTRSWRAGAPRGRASEPSRT